MSEKVEALKNTLRTILEEAQLPFVDDGKRLRIRRGSTAVFLSAKDWTSGHTLAEMLCPVLHGVKRSEAVLEELNRLNFALYFGKAYWHENGIWIAHTLLGDHIDPEELVTALGLIATVADKIDEELKEKFGGERWIDA